MINIVNKNIAIPAYQQIKKIILEQIKEGKFKPGECIPSESQLCEMYNVSRITIRQASALLINDGLLYAAPGKGTFVNEIMQDAQLEYVDSFQSLARKKNFIARINVLEEKVIKADESLAEHLKIKIGEKVIKIKRVKIANNIPIFTELRYIPYKYCPTLIKEHLADKSLTEVIKNRYHLKIKSRELFITSILLDLEYAMLLKSKEDSPGLLVTETLFLDNGFPLKWEQRVHKTGLHFVTSTVLNE